MAPSLCYCTAPGETLDCLSEEQLADLGEGRAPQGDRAEIEAHLDACADCRTALAAVTDPDGVPTLPDSAPAAARLPAPGDKIGRYLLLDVIGAGGMGVVLRAYDPQLDRKVAVKLLRTSGLSERDGAGLRARLLREAQAMARLSHANVLPVYDSGQHEGQVFVAMELVDGSTLREWIWSRAKRRSSRQILSAFASAGRGLAAAHHAGLVHRDFKPDNVLVGKDGRVRVTDFGLARLDRIPSPPGLFSGEEVSASSPLPAPAPAPDGMLRTPMTHAGALLGTPVYMAPEQLRGEEARAAADQFAFCVALWEALSDRLPFDGRTPAELLANIEKNDVKSGRHIPLGLRRTLLRGMRADPAQRHASMPALLDAIDRSPQRWLAPTAGGVALAALVAAVFIVPPRLQARACAAQEGRLEGVWDKARRAAGKARFAGRGAPWADTSWALTEKTLDQYAASWSAMAREACEAARVRHEQSEDLYDLRSACLERRRRELAAFSGAAAAANESFMQRAPALAESLTPLDGCADAPNLRAAHRQPVLGPDGAAKLQNLEELRAHALSQQWADKSAESLAEFETVRAGAAELGVEEMEIDALVQGAESLRLAGDYAGAEARLHEATARAIAIGLGATVADGLIALVHVVGLDQGRYPEGEHLGRYAQAQLKLRGGDPRREIELLETLSWVRTMHGLPAEGVELARRALEIAVRLGPGNERLEARAHEALGNALDGLGRADEAVSESKLALQAFETLYGTANPRMAVIVNTLGVAQITAGRLDEAEATLRRAVSLLGTQRADHPDRAMVIANLGDVKRQQGKPAEALEMHRQALEILLRAPADSALPPTLASAGADLLALGKPAEALLQLEAAMKASNEQSVLQRERGELLAWLAQALWETGKDKPHARKLLAEARAILGERAAQGSKSLARTLAQVDAWSRKQGLLASN